MLLDAKNMTGNFLELVCLSEDTDVFIICLGLSKGANVKIFIRRGSKSSVRLVDITKLAAALGSDVCAALIGVHPWTGCDTQSIFAGLGKMKALKILLHDQKFIDIFTSLGIRWNITSDVFCIIQEFICKLYCRNTKVTEVNELRYQMFHST